MSIRMDKRIDLRYDHYVCIRIYEPYERNIYLLVGAEFYNEIKVKLTLSDAQNVIDMLTTAINMVTDQEEEVE